jgi:hypothetical protein
LTHQRRLSYYRLDFAASSEIRSTIELTLDARQRHQPGERRA